MTLRKRRGWNQQQLANASGLSQRVISKAESGQSLLTKSILQIASALATDTDPVFAEDLITDQLAIAKEYVNAFHARQRAMPQSISLHLTPTPTFSFSSSEKKFLFAGIHEGIEEFNLAFQHFFRMFKIHWSEPESHYDFFESENQIVCWGKMKIGLVKSVNLEATTFAIRFCFARGKIKHIENHFDFQYLFDQT